MPYTPPVVNYNSGTDSTWYSLTGVQSVNIRRGRQRFQDPITQSSMVVELIPANSYTLPLAIGQTIEVRDANTATSPCYFQGRITDVQRSYSYPYNSSTGSAPADRITITATGALGAIGTSQVSNYFMTSTYAWYSITTLAATQGVAWDYTADVSDVRNSFQTLNGSALDIINKLLQTAQLTIDEKATQRSVVPTPMVITTYATGTNLNDITFTDTGTGYAYTGLEFLSSVQNTFNWVQVSAEGVGDFVTNSGSTPYNSLVYDTYSIDPTEAASLSSYLYNLLSGQVAPAPYLVSTSTTASPTCMVLARWLLSGTTTADPIMGQRVGVTFRGSTTYGTVVGVNAAFYPDRGNVQLYLAPSLGVPFTLDSSTFGVLDQNRLGFP